MVGFENLRVTEENCVSLGLLVGLLPVQFHNTPVDTGEGGRRINHAQQ